MMMLMSNNPAIITSRSSAQGLSTIRLKDRRKRKILSALA